MIFKTRRLVKAIKKIFAVWDWTTPGPRLVVLKPRVFRSDELAFTEKERVRWMETAREAYGLRVIPSVADATLCLRVTVTEWRHGVLVPEASGQEFVASKQGVASLASIRGEESR